MADIISEENVARALDSIPIPQRLKGYDYLLTGISEMIRDESYNYSITKALYPHIAKKYKTTTSGVERAIRNAIEQAWKNGGAPNYCRLLKLADQSLCIKPSNGQFISSVARQISEID